MPATQRTAAARDIAPKEATPSHESRQQRIEQHLALVKYVLERMMVKFTAHLEWGDLYAAGVIGLIKATDKFDAGRNVRFTTFAATRIRGAILDEIRQSDWLPRGLREEVSRLKSTSDGLFKRWGRPPTLGELAEELDVASDRVDSLAATLEAENVQSIEDTRQNPLFEVGLTRILASEQDLGFDPAVRMESEESADLLRGLVGTLPEPEKRVLSMPYYDGKIQKEIGAVLGLCETRVCQIHRSALRRLRHAIGATGMDAIFDAPEASA